MAGEFQVVGSNAKALFTLKVHRGDGMALLAMNWKKGKPPTDFVGFAIEYKEPGGQKFYVLKNRLSFLTSGGAVRPTHRQLSSRMRRFSALITIPPPVAITQSLRPASSSNRPGVPCHKSADTKTLVSTAQRGRRLMRWRSWRDARGEQH